MLSSFKVNNTR